MRIHEHSNIIAHQTLYHKQDDLFDGKELAKFVITTGNYMNPMNRRKLSRDDCRRIDDYLLLHNLKKYDVEKAYMMSAVVKVKSGKTNGSNHATSLQREGAVLINSLLNFKSYKDTKREKANATSTTYFQAQNNEKVSQSTNRRNYNTKKYKYKSQRTGNCGLEVIDQDDWIEIKNESLFKEKEFPDLNGDRCPQKVQEEKRWSRADSHSALGKEKNGDIPKWPKRKDATEETKSRWSSLKPNSHSRSHKNTFSGRRILKLQPRTLPLDGIKNEESAPSSIFGNARPREEVLASLLQPKEKSRIGYNELKLDAHTCETVCPYNQRLVNFVKHQKNSSGNRQWVRFLEKKLRDIVTACDTKSAVMPSLPEVSKRHLTHIKDIVLYWGMNVTYSKNSDNGTYKVDFVKDTPFIIPRTSLADVDHAYPYINFENNSTSADQSFTTSRAYEILLLSVKSDRIQGAITSHDVSEALQQANIPDTSYQIKWISNVDAVMNFSSRMQAIKVYKKLESHHRGSSKRLSVLLRGIKFNVVWWPGCVDTEWYHAQKKWQEQWIHSRALSSKEAMPQKKVGRSLSKAPIEYKGRDAVSSGTVWASLGDDTSEDENSGDYEDEEDVQGLEPQLILAIRDRKLESLSCNQTICIFCQEKLMPFSVVKRLPCNHVFHSECASQWLSLHDQCPICRHQVTQKEIFMNLSFPENCKNDAKTTLVSKDPTTRVDIYGNERSGDCEQTPPIGDNGRWTEQLAVLKRMGLVDEDKMLSVVTLLDEADGKIEEIMDKLLSLKGKPEDESQATQSTEEAWSTV